MVEFYLASRTVPEIQISTNISFRPQPALLKLAGNIPFSWTTVCGDNFIGHKPPVQLEVIKI